MLQVHDSRAGALFEKLERFLGSKNVDRRLREIDRELRIERGAYREHWVLPNRNWWLGLLEARDIRRSGHSFRGRLKGKLTLTLETAAKIDVLYRQMPVERRAEYKQRILAADNLQPTLMEIDIAGHFPQKSCTLKWLSNEGGRRMPEFIVRKDVSEWEVECKTKGCNAGRRVTRPAFYRLVDALAPKILEIGLRGSCEIILPDRIPTRPEWRADAVQSILRAIQEGRTELCLKGGERISMALRAQDGTALDENEIDRIVAKKEPHHHLAFYGPIRGGRRVDPVCIRVGSEKPDSYLADILRDLRDACRQFSGQRPALICCFVPEIDSFSGLEESSAIKDMTAYFFTKHAPPFVHSVVYSSGSQSRRLPDRVEETYFPALRFENPRTTISIPENVLIGSPRRI